MSSQKESGACWHLLLAFIRKNALPQEGQGFPEARRCWVSAAVVQECNDLHTGISASHRKNDSRKT